MKPERSFECLAGRALNKHQQQQQHRQSLSHEILTELNFSDVDLLNGHLINSTNNNTAVNLLISPARNSSLQRCKGQWRDAGFWQKMISPGGSKTFKRRRNQYTSDLNKENIESRPMDLGIFSSERCDNSIINPTNEVFTDDWKAVLEWNESRNETSLTSTLPRSKKNLQRQSLPGFIKQAALSNNISPQQKYISKSPANFLLARFKNRASRLSSSPSKNYEKYMKRDLTSLFSPKSRRELLPWMGNQNTLEAKRSVNYDCNKNKNNCKLDSNGSFCLDLNNCHSCTLLSQASQSSNTLPRPGLTQLPPTPLSPRRQLSWWSKLSTSAKEFQVSSSSALSPIADTCSPDVVLRGPDVVIDWVSTYRIC